MVTERPPDRKTILVADDDAITRQIVVTALSMKYRVLEASDGVMALDVLARTTLPDLFLCDVSMPQLDGFSLAAFLRSKPELKSLPIVFLSAKVAPSDIIHGIQLGARQYIQKPFKIQELIERVDRILR